MSVPPWAPVMSPGRKAAIVRPAPLSTLIRPVWMCAARTSSSTPMRSTTSTAVPRMSMG
jgi:hypothetical protein